jgi:hypothetical protein
MTLKRTSLLLEQASGKSNPFSTTFSVVVVGVVVVDGANVEAGAFGTISTPHTS